MNHGNYSYLVGGLLATVSPEEEQEKLNQCAETGWKLIAVTTRKRSGHDYVVYYFRRQNNGEIPQETPRFDARFSMS